MRKWLSAGIALFALLVMNGPAMAKEFPEKPITLVAPFPPGGIADILGRASGAGAGKFLGQTVAVLNKPGAGGTLGIDFLSQSKPDGYTLVGTGVTILALGMYTQDVKWTPEDFSLILGICTYNNALVVPADAPWKTFDEWVQYVKKNPGFKYGTYGALTETHLLMEWIAKRLDLKLIPVHFRGDPEGITNILGGHVQAYAGAGGHVAQVRAGKLKTILQMMGEPADPDSKSVARIKDVLPDAPRQIVEFPYCIIAPKGVPEPVRKILHDAFKKGTVDNPEFVKAAETVNLAVQYHDPKDLEVKLREAHALIGKLVKELGLERK